MISLSKKVASLILGIGLTIASVSAQADRVGFYCGSMPGSITDSVNQNVIFNTLSFDVDLKKMTGTAYYQTLNYFKFDQSVTLNSTINADLTIRNVYGMLEFTLTGNTSADLIRFFVNPNEVNRVIEGSRSQVTVSTGGSQKIVADGSVSCQQSHTSSMGHNTVDISDSQEVLSFMDGLKIQNTGEEGSFYPLRKNMKGDKYDLFCVKVQAHKSYGINWPFRGYCSLNMLDVIADDGSFYTNIVGDDAKVLYQAMDKKTVVLPAEEIGGASVYKKEIVISCQSESRCLIVAR